MGYYITMDLGKGLLIPTAHISEVVQKLQALVAIDKYIETEGEPRPVYQTIEEAVEDWRFSGRMTKEGFLITEFEGEKAGWGEDEFFEAIAPYANYFQVKVKGEDGKIWSYLFNQKVLIRMDIKEF